MGVVVSCVPQVVKGFLPVDEYGNLVKNAPRAPEVSIEGMPETTRELKKKRVTRTFYFILLFLLFLLLLPRVEIRLFFCTTCAVFWRECVEIADAY